MKREEDADKVADCETVNFQKVMQLVSVMSENQIIRVLFPLSVNESNSVGEANG